MLNSSPTLFRIGDKDNKGHPEAAMAELLLQTLNKIIVLNYVSLRWLS